MEEFKTRIETLYKNSTELIKKINETRYAFKQDFETATFVGFCDSSGNGVTLSSTEMIIRSENISIYYKTNAIQYISVEMNKLILNESIYIPNNLDYSFYSLGSESELFQLSTIVDTKNITMDFVQALNQIKEHFEYLIQ